MFAKAQPQRIWGTHPEGKVTPAAGLDSERCGFLEPVMNFEQGADPRTTEKAPIPWQIARAWPAREMRSRTEAF